MNTHAVKIRMSIFLAMYISANAIAELGVVNWAKDEETMTLQFQAEIQKLTLALTKQQISSSKYESILNNLVADFQKHLGISAQKESAPARQSSSISQSDEIEDVGIWEGESEWQIEKQYMERVKEINSRFPVNANLSGEDFSRKEEERKRLVNSANAKKKRSLEHLRQNNLKHPQTAESKIPNNNLGIQAESQNTLNDNDAEKNTGVATKRIPSVEDYSGEYDVCTKEEAMAQRRADHGVVFKLMTDGIISSDLYAKLKSAIDQKYARTLEVINNDPARQERAKMSVNKETAEIEAIGDLWYGDSHQIKRQHAGFLAESKDKVYGPQKAGLGNAKQISPDKIKELSEKWAEVERYAKAKEERSLRLLKINPERMDQLYCEYQRNLPQWQIAKQIVCDACPVVMPNGNAALPFDRFISSPKSIPQETLDSMLKSEDNLIKDGAVRIVQDDHLSLKLAGKKETRIDIPNPGTVFDLGISVTNTYCVTKGGDDYLRFNVNLDKFGISSAEDISYYYYTYFLIGNPSFFPSPLEISANGNDGLPIVSWERMPYASVLSDGSSKTNPIGAEYQIRYMLIPNLDVATSSTTRDMLYKGQSVKLTDKLVYQGLFVIDQWKEPPRKSGGWGVVTWQGNKNYVRHKLVFVFRKYDDVVQQQRN